MFTTASSRFFSGCHLFIPLFDETYDTYEGLRERSPWTFDAILAIASKIRSGNSPLSATFYKCLEEAQGIARSSLFGPVVRKEAVQGKCVVSSFGQLFAQMMSFPQVCCCWQPGAQTVGYRVDTPCAWRLTLASIVPWRSWRAATEKDVLRRKRETSVRLSLTPPVIWPHTSFLSFPPSFKHSCVRTRLAVPLLVRSPVRPHFPLISPIAVRNTEWKSHDVCVFYDRMSLGTGRPIVLRDESTIRNCRVLLSHPMASPTDVRLISQIDLIAQKSMCSLHLHLIWFRMLT